MTDLTTVTSRLHRHAITALHPRMAILLRGLRHLAKSYGSVSIDPITRPALAEVLPHGLYYVYGNIGAFSGKGGKGDRELEVLYQTLALDEPMHTTSAWQHQRSVPHHQRYVHGVQHRCSQDAQCVFPGVAAKGRVPLIPGEET